MKTTALGILAVLIVTLGGVAVWEANRGSVTTPDAKPAAAVDGRQWRTFAADTTSPSFHFKGQTAWPLYGDQRPGHRTMFSGRFAASQTFVSGAVMTAADYERVRSGYPPLRVQTYLKAGQDFQVTLPPGPGDLVFFQTPPQPDLAQAKSMAGLLALAAQGMIGAPEAAVSAEFNFNNQIFGTESDASKAKVSADFSKVPLGPATKYREP